VDPSFGYTGQYQDEESGLVYMRARYYDPATQQFLSRDPLEGASGQPYAYAWGNPVNYTDPAGLLAGEMEEKVPLRGGGQSGGGGTKPQTGGAAGDATKADPVVEAGMQQLREAIESGRIKPINARDYAGKVYSFPPGSNLAKKYPNGVRFTDLGFPDFSPYARATVRIRMRGTEADTTQARTQSRKAAGSKVTPSNGSVTWHHVEDRVTMQLVPSDLHAAVRHSGGREVIRKLGELPWEP
jgi:RHS repeat-associated protein